MTYTALVMAASRRGAEDTVAKIQGLSHKCLVVLDGSPMIQRVVDVLLATPEISRVVISVESPDIIRSVPRLRDLMDQGRITTVQSADNLFTSVKTAIENIDSPYPLLISTADNALHTPEMISHFLNSCSAGKADVYIGMTRAEDVLKAYPDGMRAFHRFRDGGYSSCNLYVLTSPATLKAARVFEGGGQFGKKPQRILKAFGLLTLICYKFQLLTLDGIAKVISRRNGLTARPVLLPYAEAPIDVDNPKDFALTEEILIKRRQQAA